MQIVSTPYFAILLRGEEESVPKLLEGIKEIISLLNKHDGPFFLGPNISIADLGVGPFVQRIFATGRAGLIPSGAYETLTTDPAFKVFVDYEKTLTSRPSFKVGLGWGLTALGWARLNRLLTGVPGCTENLRRGVRGWVHPQAGRSFARGRQVKRVRSLDRERRSVQMRPLLL